MANNKNKRKNKSNYNFVPQLKKDEASNGGIEVTGEAVVNETAVDSVVEKKAKSKKEVKEAKEVKEVADSKSEAKKADDKKKPKKEKKPSRIKKGIKEIGSELKKVSWPSFKKVVKQTGIVIGVVAFFTVILFGIDRLASLLYTLLANSIG